MDNQYRSTFIFIGFCLAVLLLIFLPDAGYTVSLIIRGSAIMGLVYAVYFYYHYLGLASGHVHYSEQDDSNKIGILSDENFAHVCLKTKGYPFSDFTSLTFVAIFMSLS